MASRTVLRGVDFPVMNKRRTLAVLEFFRRLVIEIVNFRRVAKVLGWVAVALQTKHHGKWLGMAYFFHLVHLAVAMHATDAAVHVNRMVEVNIARESVDLHPVDRLIALVGGPDWLQLRRIGEYLVVAIHTDRGGRNIGIPRGLNAVVAVSAV